MKLIPPMTMMDFFRKSEGTWFSQRTVHHFDSVEDESGESNLIVQVLAPDDPRIKDVCNLQSIDLARAAGGASFMWRNTFSNEEPNPDYAAVLVDVPDRDDSRCGRFLRDRGYVEGIPVICRYQFADDGVLTIETEYERNQGQERCWFITDDFRIRVSTVRMMNGVNLMAYCSERRCVSPDRLEQLLQQNQARASANTS